MKTPNRPRLFCRLIRAWSSLTGAAHTSESSGRIGRHIASCAECGAFFHASDELENALRRDARRVRQAPSGDLEQRIARAVRLSSEAPRRSSRWIPALSIAGAVAAAVVAILAVRRPAPTNPEVASVSRAEVAQLVDDLGSVPSRVWTSIEPSATKLTTENPLRQEIDSVYSDARSALNFLALNFLPTNRASSGREDSTTSPVQNG